MYLAIYHDLIESSQGSSYNTNMTAEVNHPSAGFLEVEHTADWELKIWAPDYAGLLEQAARGMYALAGIHLQSEPRHTVRFSVEESDAETLLVSFLQELLYLVEKENLALDTYDLQVLDTALKVKAEGAPLAAIEKEIKAVTFHNLQIRYGDQGLETNLVFDV